ncbi:hypothetical protein ScPMuIL_011993 [Solemya velum]
MADIIGSGNTDSQVCDRSLVRDESDWDRQNDSKSFISDSITVTVENLENLEQFEGASSPKDTRDCMKDSEQSKKRLKMDDSPSNQMKVSGDSEIMTSDSLSAGSSRPASSGSVGKSPLHKIKDGEKKEKEREREDRIRKAREKLTEERQKKLEEMREQQRIAQEIREKQLELRRKKIEDLRKREDERRAAVEERRRKQEEADKYRKEAILSKAKDRLTRYELWKTSGRRSGGGGIVYGFGSRTPREVCHPFDRSKRSSSHNRLLRHSPNGSDSDYSRPHRRAVSACSVVRRHCCIDINQLNGMIPGGSPPTKYLSASTSVLYHKKNAEFSSIGNLNGSDRPESMLGLNSIPENGRSFLAYAGQPPTRPKSTVNLHTASAASTLKMRDNTKTRPRKPRPASVAGSMPSFIQAEKTSGSSPRSNSRSKSTDRLSRAEKKKDEEKIDNGQTTKVANKTPSKMSKSTLERLSTPKRTTKELQNKVEEKQATPIKMKAASKKTPTDIKKTSSPVPRGSPRTSPLPPTREVKEDEDKHLDRDTVVELARFLLIEDTNPQDKRLGTLSPFVIHKGLKSTAGEPSSVKKLSSGALLLECTSKQQSSNYLKLKSFVNVSVKVAPHKTLNSCKGVIRSPDLKHATEAEIVESFVHVVDARRITLKKAEKEPEWSQDSEANNMGKPGQQQPEAPAADNHVVNEADTLLSRMEKKTVLPDDKELTPSKSEQKSTASPYTGKPSNEDVQLEEYRAKLAEKRRIAREKAEKEAELERQRQEELRLQEEERQRCEEMEQLRLEEETLRLAAEARKAEEERLQRAIEAEEERRRLEAEKTEEERKLKEEEDQRTREDAERKEKERQNKLRRDEEERIERKKRLEMIMKRVKEPTGVQAGDSKIDHSSKQLSSPSSSLDSSSEEKLEQPQLAPSEEQKLVGQVLDVPSDGSKFRSPLLQKLVDNKSQNGESPKFKSPLLQNLLGKNKSSSRLALDKSDDSSDDDRSAVMDKVSECRKDTSEYSVSLQGRIERQQEQEHSHSIIDSVPECNSNTNSQSLEINWNESDMDTRDVQVVPMDTSSLSFNGNIQSSEENTDLVESCISMRTDPMVNSQADASLADSLVESQNFQEQVSNQMCSDFEEIIDLSIANRNFEVKSQLQTGLVGTSEDLLNFNNIESTAEDKLPKPIIAFEENSNHRQDVPDPIL